MRKILCIMAVLMLACISFADVMPPYVVITNAEKISGGNDYVYVSENDGGNFVDGSPVPDITIMGHLRSTLPITRGNVPTRQNSLLNPSQPVEITSRGNTVTISDWGGDDVYSVRVFDGNGELIFLDKVGALRGQPVAGLPRGDRIRNAHFQHDAAVVQTGIGIPYSSLRPESDRFFMEKITLNQNIFIQTIGINL